MAPASPRLVTAALSTSAMSGAISGVAFVGLDLPWVFRSALILGWLLHGSVSLWAIAVANARTRWALAVVAVWCVAAASVWACGDRKYGDPCPVDAHEPACVRIPGDTMKHYCTETDTPQCQAFHARAKLEERLRHLSLNE